MQSRFREVYFDSRLVKSCRSRGNNDDKAGDDESDADNRDENDGSARSWKLAADHVVLAFEIAMESEEQNQYRWLCRLAIVQNACIPARTYRRQGTWHQAACRYAAVVTGPRGVHAG